MRQGVPTLLIAALIAGALVRSGPSAARERPRAGGDPTKPPPAPDPCVGPRQTIEDLLAVSGTASPPGDADVVEAPAANAAPEARAVGTAVAPADLPGQVDAPSVETLVATVPDPLASRLDYQFDLALSAIQMAAGAETYSFVTSWLPWRVEDRDRPGPEVAAACARREPGVLVFRTRSFVLLAFLVGETPTAGIHPAALDRAIDLAWEFQHRASREAPEVRILGPTFSGSAITLRRVLERHPVAATIISGSASLESVDELLDPLVDPALAERAARRPGCSPAASHTAAVAPARWRFRRTVHTSQELRCVAERYLESELDIRPDQIVYLVESSTGFGAGTQDEVLARRDASPGAAAAPAARPRRIVFPLHVSDVRRALDSERDVRATVSVGGVELPRAYLGLRADRSRTLGDALPTFSDASSNYEELALANEIAAACRGRARAFGVIATDARDKRYLIERARSLCPGALAFTLEADLLFAYPDDPSQVTGTLLFSSYPLFAEASRWTGDAQRIAQFGDSAAAGTYNAALAHLVEIYERYRRDRTAPPEFASYDCPFRERGRTGEPPVWISVAGRSDLLPLGATCDASGRVLYAPPLARARPPGGEEGAVALRAAAGRGPDGTEPTRGFWVMTLLLAGYCAWLAASRWTVERGRRRVVVAVHLGVAAAALLLLVVLTSAPAPAPHATWTGRVLGALALASRAAAGFSLLAVGGVALGVEPPRGPWTWRAVRRAAAVALASVALGAALHLGGRALHDQLAATTSWRLAIVRVVHLASGVSPAPPLLFLALALHVLADQGYRRLSLADARFSEGPFTRLVGASSASVAWADAQLRWIVRGGWRAPLVKAVALALLGLALVVLPWTATPEGARLDAPFRLGFAVAAVGIVACAARALLAWKALRTILRRVARHPLGRAVKEVAGLTPQERFTNLLSMRPSVRELEISELLLRRCAGPRDAAEDARRAARIAGEIARVDAGRGRHEPWCSEAFRAHERIAAEFAAAARERWAGSLGEGAAAPTAEELFVARQFTLAVAWIAAHVRERLFAAVAAALLVALAASVYPFPAARVLALAVWALLLGAALATVYVVFSFERADVAAWMAGAEPGHLVDWKLVVHVGAVCVAPVAVVLALQFPDAAARFARLLDPLLAMAK